jgi:hypothetical protein
MRSIVEEKFVAACVQAVITQAPQERGIVPLVCDDNIRVGQQSIQIHVRRVVETASQSRIGRMKCLDDSFATLFAQVVEAPTVRGFQDLDRMAQCQQFARNTAQSVSAGVVPVRDERMVEEDEAHEAFSPVESHRIYASDARDGTILRLKIRVRIKHKDFTHK